MDMGSGQCPACCWYNLIVQMSVTAFQTGGWKDITVVETTAVLFVHLSIYRW